MDLHDLPAVFDLGSRLFISEVSASYRTWDVYEVSSFFNSDPDYCLVADDGGSTVGFILGTTYEKEGAALKYGYVAWIGVEPRFQGRGVARRLYEEIERRMSGDGAGAMIMDTDEGNRTAIDFFTRMGFGQPSTQIWMTKTVAQSESRPSRGQAQRPGKRMRLKPSQPET